MQRPSRNDPNYVWDRYHREIRENSPQENLYRGRLLESMGLFHAALDCYEAARDIKGLESLKTLPF